jgi:hypothetical protein
MSAFVRKLKIGIEKAADTTTTTPSNMALQGNRVVVVASCFQQGRVRTAVLEQPFRGLYGIEYVKPLVKNHENSYSNAGTNVKFTITIATIVMQDPMPIDATMLTGKSAKNTKANNRTLPDKRMVAPEVAMVMQIAETRLSSSMSDSGSTTRSVYSSRNRVIKNIE